MTLHSKSLSDLTLRFGSSVSLLAHHDEQHQQQRAERQRSLDSAQDALPDGIGGDAVLRPSRSSLDLHHTLHIRRRRFSPHHLPTSLISRILSFLPPPDLARTLRCSRLFFHLSGPLLYHTLKLDSAAFERVLRGAAAVYEAQTGKVVVGKKRFKDRLLRYVEVVELSSHGEDEDEDEDEDDDDDGDEDGYETRDTRNSTLCPAVPLNTLFPHIQELRITFSRAFDYNLTFCSRYPTCTTCPLLQDLRVDKLVIIGARSPVVVLPLAFPVPTLSADSGAPVAVASGAGAVGAPGSSGVGSGDGTPAPSGKTGIAAKRHSVPSLIPIPSPRLSPTLLSGKSKTKPKTATRLLTPALTPPPLPGYFSAPSIMPSPSLSPSRSPSPSPSLSLSPPLCDTVDRSPLPRPKDRSSSSETYFSHSPSSSVSHTTLQPTSTSKHVHAPGNTHGHPRKHAHTNLPLGLTELDIILPSGRSYDARDYEGFAHIFKRAEPSLSTLDSLAIVFEPKKRRHSQVHPYRAGAFPKRFSERGESRDKPSLWQIAFYDSHSNPNWTSYSNLVEDLVIAILALPIRTKVDIVGTERIDGELLNLGIGAVRDGRVGEVVRERVRRRIEVRLRAEGREREVGERIGRCDFVDWEEWVGRTVAGGR